MNLLLGGRLYQAPLADDIKALSRPTATLPTPEANS